MINCFVTDAVTEANQGTSITLLKSSDYPQWLAKQSDTLKAWMTSTQFRAEPCSIRVVPAQNGKIDRVICVIDSLFDVGVLPLSLPEGVYQFEKFEMDYAIAWGMGAYQFDRYKKPKRQPAQLILSSDKDQVIAFVEAIYMVRDLVNIPTDDLGPTEFAKFTEHFANQHGATLKQIIGDDLLQENYSSIHAVGRASDDAPRLLDLRWGNAKHPKVTLIGKGVCFDSGGLDIKPSAYMLLMKKDMGGAAHVLGLAHLIMQAKLPINLRVLIPVVENAISGNAYRPGDVIKTRKGITVEVNNTDAEGRLILADALTEAASEEPELIIDIATLTGAARVALGTDIPVVFSNNDAVVNEVIKHSEKQNELFWRLPLYGKYRELLNSNIADISNCSSDSFAGAITAALYLQEFVPANVPWLHFDLMAWNIRTKPAKPEGGEALGLRALFSYLKERFK